MGMHQYKPPTWTRPIKDRFARSIAEEFGRRILALRLDARISRRVVEQRTRIDWKRVRMMEEGWSIPTLVQVVRLAELYGVATADLLDGLLGKRVKKSTLRRGPTCLCERLGPTGRAALRHVVNKLAAHSLRVQRRTKRHKKGRD